MKNDTVTKGVIVAGQYGVGKTETLIGLIRSAETSKAAESIGAFVAESAAIAIDTNRYGIMNATGVSFASVCCPTIVDMRQAIDNALKGKSHDLIFMEPPGNMHPPLMAQVAIERGIDVQHVVSLVSERDFETDRHAATFITGIEIASTIGITHSDVARAHQRNAMTKALRELNSNSPIVYFESRGLSYGTILEHPNWSLNKMAGLENFSIESSHSDHYNRMLRVINPELPYDAIASVLSEIAKTGLLARAKGSIPKYNKQIDIKGTAIELSDPAIPLARGKMGFLVCFSREDDQMPVELIDKISIAPGQKSRETLPEAPTEAKFSLFGRLLAGSANSTDKIIVNGQVSYAYSPVDEAEKIANEIYKDTGDDSAIRMVLPPYHAVRLNALRELRRKSAHENPFAGVHISSVLIHTGLGAHDQLNYTKLADQHQLIEIKRVAIPALLLYSSNLSTDKIRDFPRYESAVGPYFLKAAEIAWGSLDFNERNRLALSRLNAKENMAKIHQAAGFYDLAEKWNKW